MAGILEEIGRIDTKSASEVVAPCPKCSCPVQWKPFLVESIPWRCADCIPPAPGARVQHHRWIESAPGKDPVWRSSDDAPEAEGPSYPPIEPWIAKWLDLADARIQRDGLCRCGDLRERSIPSNLGSRIECQCGRVIRFDPITAEDLP